MSDQVDIFGVSQTKLTDTECRAIVDSLIARDASPQGATEFAWLLGHSDDGVTWGKAAGAQWKLSSDAFEKLSPHLDSEKLQQIRLFGQASETLIWRVGSEFAGRIATADHASANGPVAPDEEYRPLLGDQFIESRDGFTHVETLSGRRQVIPLEYTDEAFKQNHPLLKIVNYFRHDGSDAVRVALSRLADVVNVWAKKDSQP